VFFFFFFLFFFFVFFGVWGHDGCVKQWTQSTTGEKDTTRGK